MGICALLCFSDDDCPGAEKCCSVGCGRTCQTPVAVKKGECPAPINKRAVNCLMFCSTDADCPGSERCYSTGCGRECRLPVGVNPGYCPQFDPSILTICLVECNSDRECGLGRKCCSQGCHVYCMWAEPGSGFFSVPSAFPAPCVSKPRCWQCKPMCQAECALRELADSRRHQGLCCPLSPPQALQKGERGSGATSDQKHLSQDRSFPRERRWEEKKEEQAEAVSSVVVARPVPGCHTDKLGEVISVVGPTSGGCNVVWLDPHERDQAVLKRGPLNHSTCRGLPAPWMRAAESLRPQQAGKRAVILQKACKGWCSAQSLSKQGEAGDPFYSIRNGLHPHMGSSGEDRQGSCKLSTC
ncbi:WAP four-disulfide core domain protein 3 [Chelonia mydas]|uniref:WAP four-disulfide core domain protein 3 n=1 Tax=Chelonia mydas TaxID=8469 RepID=M7AZ14_CHEMY|nr:WAP four-disulfide core domain protein 3 [Chelonia mydas]